MTIKFKSVMDYGDQNNVTEFTESVTVSKNEIFTIYEFKEPQRGIMNWIEVAKDKINIYAGSATLNLELNKKVKIQYQLPTGVIYLDSLLLNIDISEKLISFTYTLSDGDKEVTRCTITLELSD